MCETILTHPEGGTAPVHGGADSGTEETEVHVVFKLSLFSK